MKVSIDDEWENDFGFSAVSEDELKARERALQQQVNQQSQDLEQIEETYKGKLEQLYKAVMPLLRNLAKDDKKEYIHWPDRAVKMKAFIEKVEKIVND